MKRSIITIYGSNVISKPLSWLRHPLFNESRSFIHTQLYKITSPTYFKTYYISGWAPLLTVYHIHTYTRTHTYTHTLQHLHTHTYTHTHTHTQAHDNTRISIKLSTKNLSLQTLLQPYESMLTQIDVQITDQIEDSYLKFSAFTNLRHLEIKTGSEVENSYVRIPGTRSLIVIIQRYDSSLYYSSLYYSSLYLIKKNISLIFVSLKY